MADFGIWSCTPMHDNNQAHSGQTLLIQPDFTVFPLTPADIAATQVYAVFCYDEALNKAYVIDHLRLVMFGRGHSHHETACCASSRITCYRSPFLRNR